MGCPKPLLRIGNQQTFVAHLAAVMLRNVTRLVIVLGAYADRVRVAVPSDSRVVRVENPAYTRGQLSSLKAGLNVIGENAAAVLVHLVDHPTAQPETFAALVAAYQSNKKPIIIARHRGCRGHPVLFDRSIFDEIRAAAEEEGARAVVNADPGRVLYVDVNDPGVVLDLDTPEDLKSAGLPPPPERGL